MQQMRPSGRVFWIRQLHLWHWMSAALSLVGMIVFAITGVTLNHAADIAAKPTVTTIEGIVPTEILSQLGGAKEAGPRGLPPALKHWIEREMSLRVGDRSAEWSVDEIYLAMPRAGGDAWLSIDLTTGEALYERTSRGWISYLNDLHKGRNTGLVWRGFIDVFAAGCVVFCVTGLVLLQFHAEKRPATWPLAGLGFVAPLLLVLLFVH